MYFKQAPRMPCPQRIPIAGTNNPGGRFKNCPYYFTSEASQPGTCQGGDNGEHEFISSDPAYRRGTCLPNGYPLVSDTSAATKWTAFQQGTSPQGRMQKAVVQQIIDKWKTTCGDDCDQDFINQYSNFSGPDQPFYSLVKDCSAPATGDDLHCPAGQKACPLIMASTQTEVGSRGQCAPFWAASTKASLKSTREQVYRKYCQTCLKEMGGKVSTKAIKEKCPGCLCQLAESNPDFRELRSKFEDDLQGFKYDKRCWYAPCSGLSDDSQNPNLITGDIEGVKGCPSQINVCKQVQQINITDQAQADAINASTGCNITTKADASKDTPDDGKPDGGKPDDGKPDHGKPDDGKPDDGKPDDDQDAPVPTPGKPDHGRTDDWNKSPGGAGAPPSGGARSGPSKPTQDALDANARMGGMLLGLIVLFFVVVMR